MKFSIGVHRFHLFDEAPLSLALLKHALTASVLSSKTPILVGFYENFVLHFQMFFQNEGCLA